MSFSVRAARYDPVAIETPPVMAAAIPVRRTTARSPVAADTPLRSPTVLRSPSWIPKTNSRARILRSSARF
jgi:hypothetical protein